MRTKYLSIIALMLCMGMFLFPMTAHASQGDAPPVVAAKIEDDVLQIEATGGFLGVEAVFINDVRFNYRVDGALAVDLLPFRDSEAISVYAVDFDGNLSNVVAIPNPLYSASQIPVTTSPFTPDGQASVVDNVTNEDGKEFFTFTTPEGNVFFLVIDRQRNADNVYFLNAVTESDLLALAGQSGGDASASGGIPVTTTPQNPDEPSEAADVGVEDPPPAVESGGNGTMIFLLVAVAVAGGAGYYFKIVRPKRQGGSADYDDEDEEDIGEEMEFEDEPENDMAAGERDDELLRCRRGRANRGG